MELFFPVEAMALIEKAQAYYDRGEDLPEALMAQLEEALGETDGD